MGSFLNMAQQAASAYMGNQNHPTHSPPPPQQHGGGYSGPSPYHTGPPPQQPHYQGPPPPPGAPPPPQCPPPWIAVWDANTHRYYFEDTHTRQTQWQYPGAHPPPPPQGGSNVYENVTVEKEKKSGPGYGSVALAAAGGLAGGMLLDHEGHKVKEHWEEDKYRAEERFERPFEGGRDEYRREYGASDYGRRPEYVTEERTEYIDERPGYARETETTYYDTENVRRENYGYDRRDDDYSYTERVEERVDDFPENASRWAGEKVEEVEDFPENASRWTGEKVQEVEDIPQDIEQSFERTEDRVEDFGDRIEDSYDSGRREEYYDDRGDGGW